MGLFSKLEKLSEKYIEGFFRQKFAGQLQPADIAKKLAREMRDRKRVSVSHTYVPGEYTVFVSCADFETIGALAANLEEELAEFTAAKAAEKDYILAGGPKITIKADESLGLGQMKIESHFGEPAEPLSGSEDGMPDTGTPAAGENTLVAAREALKVIPGTDPDFEHTLTRITSLSPKNVLVVKSGLKDAFTFPLGKHNVTIGRRRSNDLCLLDTGVSREHAKIEYAGGGYYLVDLGSTNGTVVNGARINSKKLEPGDVIKLGTTWLEFRVV